MPPPTVSDNFLSHDSRDLLHPSLMEPISIEFCRSVIHSGIQNPVNGCVQLVDKMTGTSILPKVQFIDPCPKAEFLSSRWHVQQVGSLFGTAINLLLLQKAVGKCGDAMSGHIPNSGTNQGRLAIRSIQEAAATGFVHNAVFRPVNDSDGEFYSARLKNGFVGAGTWATLQAGSLAFKHIGKMHDNLYGSFLRSEIGSTFLSGIPGGVVQAELRSHLDGKGWACKKDLAEAVYVQSILGSAWAAGKEVIGGTHASDYLRDQMAISSLIARGKPLPPDLLNQFPIGICPPLKLPSVPIINKQTPELKTEIEKRPH